MYFVFDLLFLDGKNLTGLPLLERKERLKALVEGATRSIQYSDHHIGDGQRFLQCACGAKAEGTVSKREDAPYVPGDRGVWRKAKCYQREEAALLAGGDAPQRRFYPRFCDHARRHSVGRFAGCMSATNNPAEGLESASSEHRKRYEKPVNTGISNEVAVA